MDFRSINQLSFRLGIFLKEYNGYSYCDAPLLASLLVLRSENPELYDKYVNNPHVADEVISYFRSGIPRDYLYSEHMALIESFLISASREELEDDRVNELMVPYKNLQSSCEASNDRSSKKYSYCNRVIQLVPELRKGMGYCKGPGFAHTKIELLQNLRT
jgi:hypothetical protein